MFRNVVLAAATSAAAVGLTIVAAGPAHAAAKDCVAVLEYTEHEITETTREACEAGEEDISECIAQLAEDDVKDDRIIVVACLAADLPTA